ncbi:helix-turn-helix domain-containing protein [Lactococcus sp. S64]|uniref:helix-turn-helix domain-containing protein n=1 Tax=Lactococcus sp. S64 TaxID=2767459 RepID=UPI001902DD55|nr:helix-turn-helix domain-containing protein [Lactococcus sp. S64]MBK0084299.1 helix-turn-helix domain-containing protein [Lactococcus sp. S64]
MEELLSKLMQRQIKILYYVLGRSETSIKEISEFFSFPKSIVKRTILDINNQFLNRFGKQDFIESSNFGVVKINSKYLSEGLDSVNKMKLSLLKDSIPFKFCVLLITNVSMSAIEIKNTLFISAPYLDKILYRLRRYLRRFNLNVEVKKGVYAITGNELHIRIFSFLILSQTFRNIEWPYTIISLDEVKKKVKVSDMVRLKYKTQAKKYSVYYLFAIFYTRIRGNHGINQYDSNVQKDLFKVLFTQFSLDNMEDKSYKDALSQTIFSEVEVYYFTFLLSISNSDMISKKNKIKLGKFLIHYNHPYCQQVNEILKEQFTYNENNEESYFLMSYILNMAIISSYLMEDTVIEFNKLIASDHLPYLDSKENEVNEYWLNTSAIELGDNQKEVVKRILYSFNNISKKSNLIIFLEMANDLSSSQYIEFKLRQTFNSERIKITNDIEKANMIITDTFEDLKYNDKVFYLDSINNKNAWSELQMYILKTFMSKE